MVRDKCPCTAGNLMVMRGMGGQSKVEPGDSATIGAAVGL
jgi:hypothetical protein